MTHSCDGGVRVTARLRPGSQDLRRCTLPIVAMKWTTAAVAAFALADSSKTSAFSPHHQTYRKSSSVAFGAQSSVFLSTSPSLFGVHGSRMASPFTTLAHKPSTSLRAAPTGMEMSYTVGIVGATGAVGKEIRQCLETRKFPVGNLRIFGSERSAGKTISTDSYGDITVESFSVDAAKECDVVFLAVSGDFAQEYARAISDGDDGVVCIDNSVGNSLSCSVSRQRNNFGFSFLSIFYSRPSVTSQACLLLSLKSMVKRPKNPS